MKIVEFSLDHPLLRESLAAVPDMEVTWVQSDVIEEGEQIQVLVWAQGGDFDRFEWAMDEESLLADPRCRATLSDRRLYQFDLVDEGVELASYPLLVRRGGVIRELRAAHDRGWTYRVAFPDHEAVRTVFSFWSDRGLDYTVHRIFDQQSGPNSDGLELTDRQREALEAAVEVGFLDVPRESTLEEFGRHLGISDTSASERFRRGTKRLINQTIRSNDDVKDE